MLKHSPQSAAGIPNEIRTPGGVQLIPITRRTGLEHGIQPCLDLRQSLGLADNDKAHHLGMVGGHHVFGLVVQLLVKLLPRSQAGEVEEIIRKCS